MSAALEHVRRSRTHRVGDAKDIGFDDITHVIGIAVGHGAGITGAGDDEVELVEAFQSRMAQALDAGVAVDAGLDRNRRVTLRRYGIFACYHRA